MVATSPLFKTTGHSAAVPFGTGTPGVTNAQKFPAQSIFGRIVHSVARRAMIATAALTFGSCLAQAVESVDGTQLACPAFHVPLRTGLSASGGALDCGQFVVTVASGEAEFAIAQGDSDKLWYSIRDMPLNTPILLATSDQQPTPVVVRRGAERLDFVIGVGLFSNPPGDWLRPRRKEEASPSPEPGMSADPDALIGTWRDQGVTLTFHGDGTFDKVSHTSPGVYGGIAGVDDSGRYSASGDELSITGNMIKKTCRFYVGPNALIFCKSKYHR